MTKRMVKSMVCALLAIVLFAMPMCASAAKDPIIRILNVNVDGARVRSSDDFNEIITSLKRGTKVLYMNDTREAYCKVCTQDGTVGYVYKGFLDSYGAARASTLCYTNTDSVRVYNRPSTSGKRLAKLDEGTCLVLYRTNGDWAAVLSLSGARGFVKLSSLSPIF